MNRLNRYTCPGGGERPPILQAPVFAKRYKSFPFLKLFPFRVKPAAFLKSCRRRSPVRRDFYVGLFWGERRPYDLKQPQNGVYLYNVKSTQNQFSADRIFLSLPPLHSNTVMFGTCSRPSRVVDVKKHWQSNALESSSRCLSPSSSLRTSSKSRTGASPRTRRISASSLSLRLNAAVRCCPWEPKTRTSRPLSRMPMSSRCGPLVVQPRRISSARALQSASPSAARAPSPSKGTEGL